ncbi:MAG TPA: hypothetical protein VF120_01835 [Ktedonobacterales bacterium]
MFTVQPIAGLVVASAGAVIIALGLSSIVFFSTVLIVVALLMRKRWDDMAPPKDRDRLR